MGRFLDSLTRDSSVYTVETTEGGLVLVGSGEEFDRLARQAIELAGDDFVALPTGNGAGGYERVVIIPI